MESEFESIYGLNKDTLFECELEFDCHPKFISEFDFKRNWIEVYTPTAKVY